jgi:hypothetical protein
LDQNKRSASDRFETAFEISILKATEIRICGEKSIFFFKSGTAERFPGVYVLT